MQKLKIELGGQSIKKAIEELEEYKEWVSKKASALSLALAEIGIKEASVRFSSAYYDGNNDVSVEVIPIDKGYSIVANGKAVCFIEFGSGVYYNQAAYPGNKPDGVVEIGEFGLGHGKFSAWAYSQENGEIKITHGNPAAMPMWYASEEIKKNISKIAREVFK